MWCMPRMTTVRTGTFRCPQDNQEPWLFAGEIPRSSKAVDFRRLVDADGQRWALEMPEGFARRPPDRRAFASRKSLRGQVVEDLRLGQAVVVERAVVVEMVAADVGHACHVEPHAGDAALVPRVAGNFHCRVRTLVGDHAGQERTEHVGGRRGVARRVRPLRRRRRIPGCPPRRRGSRPSGSTPAIRQLVVVLPFVPVTPINFSWWLGFPARAWQRRP